MENHRFFYMRFECLHSYSQNVMKCLSYIKLQTIKHTEAAAKLFMVASCDQKLFGHQYISYFLILFSKSSAPPTRAPVAPPTDATAAVAVADKPAAPADWRIATKLPAATLPPLAMAADDIMPAAVEPAAIPAPVKPAIPSATGARSAAPAAPAAVIPMTVNRAGGMFSTSLD